MRELVRRYFSSHGPATPHDFATWSGLTIGDARRELAELPEEFVAEEVDEFTWWRPAGALPRATRTPVARLLPNFDEHFIGFRDRQPLLARLDRHGPRPEWRTLLQHTMTVDGEVVGAIGPGLLVLLGVAPEDDEATARWLAKKLVDLRIFEDEQGKFNRSLLDSGGAMLVVSQFTLFGDARKGTRPSFIGAAAPEHARPMYLRFCELVREHGVQVEEGRFAAMMDVALVNDGPVTLSLERLARSAAP